MQEVIKSSALGVERPASESNDCTVRALANAYNMPYGLSHRIFSKAGREQGKGVKCSVTHATYTRLGFELIGIYGDTVKAKYLSRYVVKIQRNKGITLKNIMPQLQQGRYIVGIRGHVFAVVDGQILDYGHNYANSRVVEVYRLNTQHVVF